MNFDVRGRLSQRTDLELQVLGIGLLVALWSALTYTGVVRPIFLPTPTGLLAGGYDLYRQHILVPSALISMWRIAQALFWTAVVGIPIGVLMGSFAPFDALIRAPVGGAKAVPTTTLVPLVILWFGLQETAMIVFLFLGAIFYMVLLVRAAVLAVREEYVRTAIDLGANRWQMVTGVLLPGSLAGIWDALIVCNALMWTYIVLAEYINGQNGLGYMINIAGRLQRSDQVYAGILLISLIAVASDWLLRRLQRWLLAW